MVVAVCSKAPLGNSTFAALMQILYYIVSTVVFNGKAFQVSWFQKEISSCKWRANNYAIGCFKLKVKSRVGLKLYGHNCWLKALLSLFYPRPYLCAFWTICKEIRAEMNSGWINLNCSFVMLAFVYKFHCDITAKWLKVKQNVS